MSPRRVDPSVLVAVLAFFALLVVALFGERLAPHEDIYFVVEHGKALRPFDPGVVFPLGSDPLGRDLFSLVLAGAGTTLALVLVAGAARVTAGLVMAAVAGWWRPAALGLGSISHVIAAIPATIVALVLLKVFTRGDATILTFAGALLVVGWAGPYRVIRAELDRISRAPFTEGARAIGIGRLRLLLRHQTPHLVPILMTSLAQQVVSSLVLVAELGVLGLFVGTQRFIDVEESLSVVRPGVPNEAMLADKPEWGGLLAGSRTVLALWVTRWLILLPGAAFALTAVAIAVVGFALARRYAHHDIVADIRGRGAVGVALAVVALLVASAALPVRYAEARDWAAEARAEMRDGDDIERAFTEAGLRPVAEGFEVKWEVASVQQSGPASVEIGAGGVEESPWPRTLRDVRDPGRTMRAFVTSKTGGGAVEAPLVFAGRGIAFDDYRPLSQPTTFRQPDFAQLIRDLDYADDYAGIDVRGKVVLLARFYGIEGPRPNELRNGYAHGPFVGTSIANAIKRGAAAVIFVDASLPLYQDRYTMFSFVRGAIGGGLNPYIGVEESERPTQLGGVPVIVLSDAAASQLLAPLGLDLSGFYRYDERQKGLHAVSPSRDLGVTARVEVPLIRQATAITSYVAEVGDAPLDLPRIVVWAPRSSDPPDRAMDSMAAVARALSGRRLPMVLVAFDPAVHARASAKQIQALLDAGERSIGLVIVLDRLTGPALRFATPHGELIPAFDRYAEESDARFVPTRMTAGNVEIENVSPFLGVPTVVVTGSGCCGDLSEEAAALVGYIAGRLALGAPELGR